MFASDVLVRLGSDGEGHSLSVGELASGFAEADLVAAIRRGTLPMPLPGSQPARANVEADSLGWSSSAQNDYIEYINGA